MESVKYHFYFDHLYNTCKYKNPTELKFCKLCLEVYKENETDIPHKCSGVVDPENEESKSEIEKRLTNLYISIPNSNKNSSNNILTSNSLPTGTINIPR